jgi:HPt (histidine-containing phosphotransfer) domain-containing protein
LAMTANATSEDREQSISAGMNEHIAKPIAPNILFEALLQWVPHGDRELPDTLQTADAVQDQAASRHLDADLPGIDTAGGLERMGGRVESYIKLLHKFAHNQANVVSDLSSAQSDGDKTLALRLAHTLKGVSGNIGATELQQLSAELETAIKESTDDQANRLLAAIGVELNRVIGLIEMLGSDKPAAKPAAPKELPQDLLPQLLALMDKLDDYDAAAEDVIYDILATVEGMPIHGRLSSVKKLIAGYDMEGAAAELKPLIEELHNPDNEV